MLESDRIISTQAVRNEDYIDKAIRPMSLQDYIGQNDVKNQFIQILAFRF